MNENPETSSGSDSQTLHCRPVFPEERPTWEYRVESFETTRVDNPDNTISWRTGGAKFKDALPDLGREGWELVSTMVNDPVILATFKRQSGWMTYKPAETEKAEKGTDNAALAPVPETKKPACANCSTDFGGATEPAHCICPPKPEPK